MSDEGDRHIKKLEKENDKLKKELEKEKKAHEKTKKEFEESKRVSCRRNNKEKRGLFVF